MDTDDALAALSLEDKVRLLTGADIFTLQADERLGLAPMAFSDGPTGVRGLKFSGGRRGRAVPERHPARRGRGARTPRTRWAGCSPRRRSPSGSTWCSARRSTCTAPPLGGRLFEAYSEDPLLTGKLAAAYVRGMQDSGVGACLKHLVANESETDRTTVNSVVDEATLRELYLLPFEIAVADADAWSIMAAYNDVNGVPATEQHHVNNEVRQGRVGLPGLIMSDWFATKTAAPGRERRPRPGDARPARPLGRRAGRGRAHRRGRRVGRRRPPGAGCCCWPSGSARWASTRDLAAPTARPGQRRPPRAADPARRAAA